MYKKYLRNISMIFLCAFATFVYFKNDDVKTVKKKANMQTVIFKDQDETLIPVSVDIGVKDNKENNIRGIIETMKSKDFTQLGLYPIFNKKLELNALIMESNQLTFDFTNNFKVSNNQHALDICEALSYLFCKDGISKINMKIDGKAVSSFENTTIPLSCITPNLGINNFETSTFDLYQTSSVLVYNEKEIAGKTYYIPTTTRIQNTNQTIDQKVSLLLDHFENNTKVETTKKSQLNDGLLSIYLSSRILDNSENISPTLYSRLEKSFLSLPDVSSVHIYINNELIQEDQNVSTSIDNIVQI
jgi:germination protein M